jgi:hypothetical protein
LAIDNVRSCTLPLSDAEKVLVVDGDPDARGAYHIASVLNPGSQVRIGAIPDIQPPSFLRSMSLETVSAYRAVYLIDVAGFSDASGEVLGQYVRRGGGLAWFLGSSVDPESYNRNLYDAERYLLPGRLDAPLDLPAAEEEATGDIGFGQRASFLDPLRGGGDAAFALVGVAKSWSLLPEEDDPIGSGGEPKPRVRTVLRRRDDVPLVTRHDLGRGRVVTVMTGIDGRWTNWPSDPTFVPMVLLTNATLWGGAAPPTHRLVDQPLSRRLATRRFAPDASYLPAVPEPPRVAIDVVARPLEDANGGQSDPETAETTDVLEIDLDPSEMVIRGEENVDEILRAGVSEWMFTRVDGSTEVVPVASVLRVGEGDLQRADSAEIRQKLMPVEVKFVTSSVWSEENRAAGSSTLTLLLLGLLGTILAGEQMLAYWASYHVAPSRGGG